MSLADIIFAAAPQQVPTGIPTGVPAPAPPPVAATVAEALPGLSDALQGIATEHGLLGALLVIAIGAIVALWLRGNKIEAAHAEEREDWQRQIQQSAKDRLSDQREIITALNNSSGVISVNSQRMAETAASTHDIANKFEAVAYIIRGNGDLLKSNNTLLEDNRRDIIWLTRNAAGGPRGGNS